MGFIASGVFDKWGLRLPGLAVAIALGLPAPPSLAAGMRVPTCAQFVEFGRGWVGLDEERLAQGLGLPLYQLTDSDIDLIIQTLRRCLAAAESHDDKAVLDEELKHPGSLRAARDRVRRAFGVFETAMKKARPKLEQIVAKIDALPATPASRNAVEDAEATVSAISFELDQKRIRAQVKETLTEGFPPYANALAALGRKRKAYAEAARKELVAQAGDAFQKHRADYDRLDLPAAAQEATIILEGIDAGSDVRWLTLRQWASLVLGNPAVDSVKVAGADAGTLEISVSRPGYGATGFAFRQDGRELRLGRVTVDGRSSVVATPDDRRQANNLLIAVARTR